jgi:hypothetical protein
MAVRATTMPRLRPFSPERLLRYLNNDGGIPYAPGGPSFSEPTLLTILACIAAEEAPLTRPLVEWVLKNRNPDGSIGLNREFPHEGLWNSPLLAIAAHHLSLKAERDAAIDFVIKVRSISLKRSPDNDLNTELVGWPWVPDTFGWVEPTSWALLSLSIAGKDDHPRAMEARRLLEDRCIPEGGWNYGNRMVFGHVLMPFWETTALALLALGESNKNLTDRNLDLLERSLSEIHSLFSHALVSLCLERFGRNTKGMQNRITAMLQDNEIESLNLAHSAMGVIALSQRRVLTS